MRSYSRSWQAGGVGVEATIDGGTCAVLGKVTQTGYPGRWYR
jgi:hypothetical protein